MSPQVVLTHTLHRPCIQAFIRQIGQGTAAISVTSLEADEITCSNRPAAHDNCSAGCLPKIFVGLVCADLTMKLMQQSMFHPTRAHSCEQAQTLHITACSMERLSCAHENGCELEETCFAASHSQFNSAPATSSTKL